MVIFLDETGQFNKQKNGEYFIIGSFTTGDPRRTAKRFHAWRHDHFPKKIRDLPEIKFSNNLIDDRLRVNTLREIVKLDVRIRYAFLAQKNIPLDYIYHDKVRTGHLYTNLVAQLLETYLPVSDNEFRVFCDQRNLKGVSQKEFIEDITANSLPHLSPKTIVQIAMIDSTTNDNIQIADWITGALGRFYNKGRLGEELFFTLKNNFISPGVELFKDTWSINQKTQPKD